MRHRLDRLERTTKDPQQQQQQYSPRHYYSQPNKKDLFRQEKQQQQQHHEIVLTKSDSPDNKMTKINRYNDNHSHTMLGALELEMESEHDEDEAMLPRPSSSSLSSPVRERTRAAHHNGSVVVPRPSPLFSSSSSSSLPLTRWASSKFIQWTLVLLSATFLLVYLVPPQVLVPPNQIKKEEASTLPQERPRGRRSPPKISYTCPPRHDIDTPRNRDDATHGKWYDQVSQQLLKDGNLTNYLQVYRQTQFDNWGLTYEQVKESMRDWKEAMFAPVLDNPNRIYSIYESACGIGLNLALTTEILYETRPTLKRLEVYGNDYVEESITLAERLYQQGQIVEDYKGRMGRFCAADSTHLEHVPSDSFDLVFTGYITPLTDPLNIAHKYDKARDVERAYQAVCENTTNPALVQQMQDAQEDFFRQWVAEMVRIARPGAPVIVEQVSLPLCDAYYDWGGVPREFWNASVSEWPVDADSLVFRDDTIVRGRYHVYFRKQK